MLTPYFGLKCRFFFEMFKLLKKSVFVTFYFYVNRKMFCSDRNIIFLNDNQDNFYSGHFYMQIDVPFFFLSKFGRVDFELFVFKC